MVDQDALKRAAAEAALSFLPPRGVIGLGTGSTSMHAIRLIADRILAVRSAGSGVNEAPWVGVATSIATARVAREAEIPLLDERGPWDIAVTFDGADEVDANLDLIKGGGGALLREKIVNAATALNVIMVDETKLSDQLGLRFRLPVEVTPFGWQQTRRLIETITGPAVLRASNGVTFVTDNGNYILDIETGAIPDPAGLERELASVPGIVTTGLFTARTDVLVLARPGGVEIRRPKNAVMPEE